MGGREIKTPYLPLHFQFPGLIDVSSPKSHNLQCKYPVDAYLTLGLSLIFIDTLNPNTGVPNPLSPNASG